MHLLVKRDQCFLQLKSGEPDHLLAVYLPPPLRSADLLAGINDQVGPTPFHFLKLPHKLLPFLQRRLTNDILLLHSYKLWRRSGPKYIRLLIQPVAIR